MPEPGRGGNWEEKVWEVGTTDTSPPPAFLHLYVQPVNTIDGSPLSIVMIYFAEMRNFLKIIKILRNAIKIFNVD